MWRVHALCAGFHHTPLLSRNTSGRRRTPPVPTVWAASHLLWEACHGGRGGWAPSHRVVGGLSFATKNVPLGIVARPCSVPLRGRARWAVGLCASPHCEGSDWDAPQRGTFQCGHSQRGHGQRKGSQCDPCQCAGSHRPRRPPGKPATRVVANAQAATVVRRRARAPTAGVQGHPLRDCALREATGLGGLPLRPLPVGNCAVGALPSSVGEVPVRSFACRGRIQKKYRPPGSVVTSASKSCSLTAELCLLV